MGEQNIKLPRELTIFTVEVFWKRLVETIEQKDKLDDNMLILDFTDLDKIDGSGIQLLLSLEKTMLKEKFQVTYQSVKESIRKVLKLVGVEYLVVMAGEKNE